jgi:VanZ family protein
MTHLLQILKKYPVQLVYFPLAVYWILISLSITISPDVLFKYSFNDKLEHGISFFILTILIVLANLVQSKFKILMNRPFFGAFLIVGLYGTSSEIVQYFLPQRYCDYLDLAANFAGSALAIATSFLLLRKSISQLNNN